MTLFWTTILSKIVADIYDLERRRLWNRWKDLGEKSAKNIGNFDHKKRETTLPRFLTALGIFPVGEETAELSAKEAKSIGSFKQDVIRRFAKIKGIGPKVAETVYGWFRDKNKVFLEKIIKKN